MNQQNFSRFYAEIQNSCNIIDIVGNNNNVKKQWRQKQFLHEDWLLCSPGVQRLEHVMQFFTEEGKKSFLFGRCAVLHCDSLHVIYRAVIRLTVFCVV